MDTEQYEDAVRDYEKVYQTEKTKGEHIGNFFVVAFVSFFPPTICSDLQPFAPAGQYGKVPRSALKCLSQNFSPSMEC